MEKYLKNLPEELKSLINKIRFAAGDKKVKAYLVGGFVRDLLLGVKNLDLDIVVEGDGIKFARDFAESLGVKITAHESFGTATVFIGHKLKIDFSSSRKEYYPKPAHLPEVEPGTLRDDLFRRDFTINAMAISLDGFSLVDYFGGLADLRRKIVRVMHPLSFIDDPTRILRAVRFEQRYDFKIEPVTLGLLRQAVGAGLLEQVHPHRRRDDLILILKEEEPAKEIKRLAKLTGFDFISPRLKANARTYALLRAFKAQVGYFNKNYTRRRPLDAWVIYLIALLDSLDVKTARAVCARFGLRKGEEKRVLSYKQMKIKAFNYLRKASVKPSRIFALLEPLSYETILALRGTYADPVFRRNITDFLDIYNGMRILVGGEDLRGMGVLPGPKYQKIFALVLRAKLNGLVKTKADELALIRKLLKDR